MNVLIQSAKFLTLAFILGSFYLFSPFLIQTVKADNFLTISPSAGTYVGSTLGITISGGSNTGCNWIGEGWIDYTIDGVPQSAGSAPLNNTLSGYGTHTVSASGYSGESSGFECAIPTSATWTFNLVPPPNCDTGLSCSGACTAPANTCSANNGTRTGCVYTTYSGGGSCTQVGAPNQPCTLSNCNAGYTCTSGNCVPVVPPLTVSCSPSSNTTVINAPVTWSAIVSGGAGPGTYTYSWSGTHGPTGAGVTDSPTTNHINVTYTSTTPPGTPNSASVTVSSGGVNYPAQACSGTVTVIPSGSANCFNNHYRLQGLLSTPVLNTPQHFGNPTGQCVVGIGSALTQAGIASFKIPTYSELINTYFERKATITTGSNQIDKQILTGNQTGLDFRGGGCGANCSRLWHLTGSLNIPNQASIQTSVNQNAVVFVDGNLNVGDLFVTSNDDNCTTAACQDVTYGDNNSGIVYIVRGNVNMGRNIHRFDGTIISQGTICTSYDATCTPDEHHFTDRGGETKQLIVNGNLISLDSTHPIQFERNLEFSTNAFPNGNDNDPAELINLQPKYLVVMRNLLSDTLSIQTEDTHYAVNQ
jgi:hypothetical protein